MLEKLQLIQELSGLFSCADVHLMPDSEEELRIYLKENISPRLGADLSNHPAIRQVCTLNSSHIHEFAPFPGIVTLLYPCRNLGKILFIGPVATEQYSANAFLAYLQQQSISHQAMEQMTETASHLPIVATHQLYQFAEIILRHICGIQVPVPVQKVDAAENAAPLSLFRDVAPPQDISQIRQVEDRYKASTLLTEAVKLGNLSLALQTLRHRGNQFEGLIRNRNPLRNMQNQCIILNTQLRHALESMGIHPFSLDHLSSEIGLQIEQLSTMNSAMHFGTHIIEQYCRLVQEQSYSNLSTLTHQAVIYIKNNLHNNLTVRETAKALSVHPDYLSHQFSKEMGMTFIAFLNQERCRQAASYLKHTSLQIKEISAIVGFNTISYFTKQFSQMYGKSPRDYRNDRIFRKHHARI